jgi:hypothetical protein
MSYSTPHTAHEFMKAAALGVVHQYHMALRTKQAAIRTQVLVKKAEIDFNSRLALYFGPEASISAQGKRGLDLHLKAPVLDVEVKYLRRLEKKNQPVNKWPGVMKDWKWLLALSNENNNVFRQSAWVVFLPSIDLFPFHSNFQVPGTQLLNQVIPDPAFAPFLKIAEPDPNQPTQLRYCQVAFDRDVLLTTGTTKPKQVRRELVGNPKHSVWALVYSRVGTKAAKCLPNLPPITF